MWICANLGRKSLATQGLSERENADGSRGSEAEGLTAVVEGAGWCRRADALTRSRDDMGAELVKVMA